MLDSSDQLLLHVISNGMRQGTNELGFAILDAGHVVGASSARTTDLKFQDVLPQSQLSWSHVPWLLGHVVHQVLIPIPVPGKFIENVLIDELLD